MTDINCDWIKLIKILLPRQKYNTDTINDDNGNLFDSFCEMSNKGQNRNKSFIQRHQRSQGTFYGVVICICILIFPSLCLCSVSAESSDKPGPTIIIDTPDASSSEGMANRAEKVKAKWKGESFWTESVANLTIMESEKIKESSKEVSSTTSQTASTEGASSSRKISSPTTSTISAFNLPPPRDPNVKISPEIEAPVIYKKKSSKNKHMERYRGQPVQTKTTHFNLKQPPTKSPQKKVPRTTLQADLSSYGQEYYLEYNDNDKVSDEIISTKVRAKAKPVTKHSKIKRKKKKDKLPQRKKDKYAAFGFPRPKSKPKVNSTENVPVKIIKTTTSINNYTSEEEESNEDKDNRATLVADLAPYGQNIYLEYESDENSGSKEKLDTNNVTGNGSLIQFYPKSPVNLITLLQALTANLQPIKMMSPVGGPAPSIPLQYNVNITNRVPMTVNPPPSPFLLSLDLDSFFTRMAISVFYSGIAIAPLIYLMMGGLGGLGGLSTLAVPFTGRRRRRRRNAPIEENNDDDNFDFYDVHNIEQVEVAFKELYNLFKIDNKW